MKKALRYIDAHLSDDLRLEDVASHVYLSPYYFSKLFKNIMELVLMLGLINREWPAPVNYLATVTGVLAALREISVSRKPAIFAKCFVRHTR